MVLCDRQGTPRQAQLIETQCPVYACVPGVADAVEQANDSGAGRDIRAPRHNQAGSARHAAVAPEQEATIVVGDRARMLLLPRHQAIRRQGIEMRPERDGWVHLSHVEGGELASLNPLPAPTSVRDHSVDFRWHKLHRHHILMVVPVEAEGRPVPKARGRLQDILRPVDTHGRIVSRSPALPYIGPPPGSHMIADSTKEACG